MPAKTQGDSSVASAFASFSNSTTRSVNGTRCVARFLVADSGKVHHFASRSTSAHRILKTSPGRCALESPHLTARGPVPVRRRRASAGATRGSSQGLGCRPRAPRCNRAVPGPAASWPSELPAGSDIRRHRAPSGQRGAAICRTSTEVPLIGRAPHPKLPAMARCGPGRRMRTLRRNRRVLDVSMKQARGWIVRIVLRAAALTVCHTAFGRRVRRDGATGRRRASGARRSAMIFESNRCGSARVTARSHQGAKR